MITKNYTAPQIGTGTESDPYISKVDQYVTQDNSSWCCRNGLVSGDNSTMVVATQAEHDSIVADSEITEE